MLLFAAFVLRLFLYSYTVAFNLQNIHKGIFLYIVSLSV